MENKTVIITGGNSGLGYECVKTISRATKNWFIVIASRNLEKSLQVKEDILKEFPDQEIDVLNLDLASLQSVQDFVVKFKEQKYPPLYGLICNSGILIREGIKKSAEGHEMTFAVNHLGHFLLTNLLIDEFQPMAKIIVVSSNMHNSSIREGKMAPAEFIGVENLAAVDGKNTLDGFRRYSTSKLCNLLFTYELDRIFKEQKKQITVNAFDPGFSPGTGLTAGGSRFMSFMMGSWFMKFMMWVMGIVTSTPKKSGKAMARLLLDSELDSVSGKYFQINKEINSSPDSYNLSYAQELWGKSVKMLNLEARNKLSI